MVDRWFLENLRQINKRGALLNRLKSRRSYYWPGTDYKNGSRTVRIPYNLNVGFFTKLFGKRRLFILLVLNEQGCLYFLYVFARLEVQKGTGP